MPMRLGETLPAFDGASLWYNGDASEVLSQKGPLLVHFWAVSCYLCKNNFVKLQEWRQNYGPRGLRFIAVHMPRQEEDTNQELVQKALLDYSITEPCAVDNQHLLKDAFKNEQAWVPVYYLFDEHGVLKSRTAGEAGTTMLTGALERLFVEPQVTA